MFNCSSPSELKHKKQSKKNSVHSNHGNAILHSSEHEQGNCGETSSRFVENEHEKRSSMNDSTRRRSRSKEKEKAQEPSFLPDVLGNEGW